MSSKKIDWEKILRQKLGDDSIKDVSVTEEKPRDSFAISATKLYPVELEDETVYTSIPISGKAELNSNGTIESLSMDDSGEWESSAQGELSALFQRGMIFGFKNEKNPKATHMIEENDQGQKVVRRRRVY